MNCIRCLEKGRKSYAYFITDEPICMSCYLWEPPTPAEQKRWRNYNDAHADVSVAKAKGTLKTQPCEVCGSTVSVEAHHEDYSRPLDVRWLCNYHHRRVTWGKLKLPERSATT
jgi:hypothetical protein